MKRILFSTLLAVMTLVAGAARADWQTDYIAAQKALDAKDYGAAENACIAALNATDALPEDHDDKIKTELLLARIYQDTRQWAAAMPLYEKVMGVYKGKGMDGSPEAAAVYNSMGIVYVKMKELIKAEDAFKASLQIRRKKYKQNVASIAMVLSNLGELYRQQRKWKEAEELHKQAITDKENELGPEHPTLVTSLNNLGIVYRETGRMDEAKAILVRAVELGKKAADADPNERVNYGTALSNLAEWHATKREFEKAKTLYEDALRVRRAALGSEHPHVAETLMNYANMLTQWDKGADALPMYDEAITIRKNEFGLSDERTWKAMMNKVMCLERLGKAADAKALRDEVEALKAKPKSN